MPPASPEVCCTHQRGCIHWAQLHCLANSRSPSSIKFEPSDSSVIATGFSWKYHVCHLSRLECHWRYVLCIYMGAARFPGPPNLHDLQNWFKQLILQLPICICIVQHVTWEIGLPSFIETVQGVRSAPHRSFTLHKVFQRLVKENKEK